MPLTLPLLVMIGACRGFGIRNLSRAPSFAARNGGGGPTCFPSRLAGRSSSLWASPPEEETWVYKPYVKPKASPQRRRKFSSGTWVTPKSFPVPEDKLDFSYVRSSGAGGQHVNKVNTQAVLRFHVMDATWIPLEVRERISVQSAARINKEGLMVISTQEFRTQIQNRKRALEKVEELILSAWARPVVRKVKKGHSKAAKLRNKETKRKQSDKKASRKQVNW